MITLTVRPHIERAGYHLDRFDAYLGEQIVAVSRQPMYDGARALLDLGYDPETLLTIRHAGKDYDSFEPRSLAELAQWTIVEGDQRGLQRRRWQPYHGPRSEPVGSPAHEEAA